MTVDLFSARVSDWKLLLDLSVPFVLLAALVAGALLWRARRLFRSWDPVDVEVPFGTIGKLRIKPNHEVVQVAHRAWVELATRKAGLLFEPENDVIVEVYDSWYQLFAEMRRLAKELPADRIRSDADTQKALTLIVDGLNLGLRPHLTKWQARFRHWYTQALRDNPAAPPQDIQRAYPQYDELVADLLVVNQKLILYMSELRKLVQSPRS